MQQGYDYQAYRRHVAARVAGRDLAEVMIDVDATLVEVHSAKQ